MTLEVSPSGRGFTLVTCDAVGCGMSLEVEASTDHRAVDQAEREGWEFPDSSDRCFCPDCPTLTWTIPARALTGEGL